MHNKKYEEILNTMPEGLDKQVLSILSYHVGRENAITRKGLISAIDGKPFSGDIQTSSLDRQIREAISGLQETTLIISDSGKGGYYIPANMEEVKDYTSEITSRARELENKARNILALAESEFNKIKQLSLI